MYFKTQCEPTSVFVVIGHSICSFNNVKRVNIYELDYKLVHFLGQCAHYPLCDNQLLTCIMFLLILITFTRICIFVRSVTQLDKSVLSCRHEGCQNKDSLFFHNSMLTVSKQYQSFFFLRWSKLTACESSGAIQCEWIFNELSTV